MDRKNTNLREKNIAARDKGLIVVGELDRLVRAFNKALGDKDDWIKSIETELQGLGESLQENLDYQYSLDRNFEIYDENIEKILFNLQQLESEEKAHAGRYERLLKGVGIENDYQNSETSPDAVLADNDQDKLDTLEQLRNRRESFLNNLNQEFENLEEKLTSINKLKKELEDSRNEIRGKKVHSLGKKEALEEEGKKLLNEVGRLEKELETTCLEERNLIEESVKMIKQVEDSLELGEKIEHILFSSENLVESSETTPTNSHSENGHEIAIGI
jgi:chromosome segregation ATPase